MCVWGGCVWFGGLQGRHSLVQPGITLDFCSKSAEITGVCQHSWLMWFQGLDSTLPHAKQALALPTALPLHLQAFAFRKTCRTSHRKITQRETFCSNSPSWASAVGGGGGSGVCMCVLMCGGQRGCWRCLLLLPSYCLRQSLAEPEAHEFS